MNRFFVTGALTVFLILETIALRAQTPVNEIQRVSLDNTEQFSIASESVKGENYIIQVGLPASYNKSHRSYPVLYILDGDKSFGMTKEITDWLMWSGEIKDIIIVGISYGKGTAAWWEKRARDYTQYKDTVYYYYPNAGGAEDFLAFIKNELFPAINNKYRISPDSTAFMGISFGGLLTSYTLFSHPDMFKDFIIISPALFWNNNSILNTESLYFKNNKELDKSVYLAYGTLDDDKWTKSPSDEFIRTVQNHNYNGLKFSTEIFKGETHISVYPMALTHALKLLFRTGK
jgi:predicted alpha/beta superfamily hydrolase